MSLVVWKMDPSRTSASRSSCAFTRLPLWQIAISPCAQSMRIGCAFLRPLSPDVEYRTWPTALTPFSRSIVGSSKLSAT